MKSTLQAELETATELNKLDFPRPDNWRERITFVCGRTGDTLYLPSLVEVIESLGDKFGVLERFKDGSFGAYIPNDIGVNGIGVTAHDAVMKLWIATRGNEA